MRVKLHTPRKLVWQLAGIVFAVGLALKALPFLDVPSEPFFIASTLLLLLGTWVF